MQLLLIMKSDYAYGGTGKNGLSNKNYSQNDLDEAKKSTQFLSKNAQPKSSITSGTAGSSSNNRGKPFKPNFESSTKPSENFVVESKLTKNTQGTQGIQGNRLNFMQKYGGTSGLNPQTNKVGQDMYSNTNNTAKPIKEQGGTKVKLI